jgi:hypothetical protein
MTTSVLVGQNASFLAMDSNKRYTLYLLIVGALVISILSMVQIYHESESSQRTGKSLNVVSPVIEKNPLNNSKTQEEVSTTSTQSRGSSSSAGSSTSSSQPESDISTTETNNEAKSTAGSSSGGGGGGGSSSDNNQNAAPSNDANTNNNANQNTQPITPVSGNICNPSVLTNGGLDTWRIMDVTACNLLNTLYAAGTAAGNAGDVYYNLDNKHVNLCFDWTPNPDCPERYRPFYQHEWRFSDQGRVTSPVSSVTVGQASYGGVDNHGIAYVYYQNQHNAEEAYRLYTNNNLYIYPSLEDDSYLGAKQEADTMTNPVPNIAKANIANTPYVIGSKQITKPGTDYYMIHEASSSEMPFVKLTLAAFAALKPEVKKRLSQQVSAQGTTATFLIPTVQMLLRYSHKSVNTNTDYLNSAKVHRSAYLAHDFVNGIPQPAYDATKLITMANSLNLNDIPPLVQLRVVSENFDQSEKLFDTPGAIARSVSYNAATKTITVNAQHSFDIEGRTDNLEYQWKALDNSQNVKITVNPQNSGEATIEFYPATATQRVDVFVFVKRSDGKYYSVPGVISNYIHS